MNRDHELDHLLFRDENDYLRAVLLLGRPGIGKSGIAKELIPFAKHVVVYSLAENPDATMFGAYPVPVTFQDRRPEIFQVLSQEALKPLLKENIGDDYGMLVLDDVGGAYPAVQTAALNLVQNRKIAENELGRNVGLVLTTNNIQDDAGAVSINKALMGRCNAVNVEPNFDIWLNHHTNHNTNSMIVHFLKERFDCFAPSIGDTNFCDSVNGKTPSPRDWTSLSRILNRVGDPNRFIPNILYPDFDALIYSTVGDTVGKAFIVLSEHFIRFPSSASLLENPGLWDQLDENDRLSSNSRFVALYGAREHVVHYCQAYKQNAMDLINRYFKLILKLSYGENDLVSLALTSMIDRFSNQLDLFRVFSQVSKNYFKDPQIASVIESNKKYKNAS